MKTRLLIIIGIIVIVGVSQIPESFSEDSVPSCNIGAFVSDNIQCYTRDSPPCPSPSFEKNGLCVVKKIDLCEKDYVMLDGVCKISNIRIDDPTFTKQHLLTGQPVIVSNPDDFRITGNPNECWTQEDDGTMTPCKINSTGPNMIISMGLYVFWPYIILGIILVIIFIIWRKRK